MALEDSCPEARRLRRKPLNIQEAILRLQN
jgi:hypothetical protein